MERNKMKLSRYFLFSCMLVFMACSNDEILNDESTQEKSMITAIGNLPSGANTRMSYNEQTSAEGNPELAILWDYEERIGVTDGTNKYIFNLVNFKGQSASAQFESTQAIAASKGATFYAVYPEEFLGGVNVNQASLGLDFKDEKGSAVFKTILWAKAQLKDDNTLSFNFDYVTSVLKIRIKPFVDTDPIAPYVTPTTSYSLMQQQLVLKASEGLYESATLNMNNGTLDGQVPATELLLNSVDFFYNSETKTTSFTEECFKSFFPGRITNFRICFELIDGIYEAKVTDSFDFVKGKFYYTDELSPTKVGFIVAKTDLTDANYNEGTKAISLSTVLQRITNRDTQCNASSRKTLYLRSNNSCPFRIYPFFTCDTDFSSSEFEPSSEYMDIGYTTKASILGNWLRTKGTSVELVDMSLSGLTTVPAYMFYGCSKAENIGNSALTKLVLPSEITVIGNNAFADSGIKHLVLTNASSLTTVTTPFGSGTNVSDVTIYLAGKSSSSEATYIRSLFKVGESVPTVYYRSSDETLTGDDYFDTANYTKLE